MSYLVLKIANNKVEQQDISISRSDAAQLGARMVSDKPDARNEEQQSKIQDMLYNNSYAHGTNWALQLLWMNTTVSPAFIRTQG